MKAYIVTNIGRESEDYDESIIMTEDDIVFCMVDDGDNKPLIVREVTLGDYCEVTLDKKLRFGKKSKTMPKLARAKK